MSGASTNRKPRQDAIANRERILDRAEQVMTAEGLDLSLHRLAKDVGVGVGTVYRHFPTIDELHLAVYRRYSARIEVAGQELLLVTDPHERVVAFIDLQIRFALENPIARRVAERVQRHFPEAVVPSYRWSAVVIEAVTAAQAAGRLRPDASATDIAIVGGMLAELVSVGEPQASVLVPRMRSLLLDALRPVGQERPGLPAHPISLRELTDLTHRYR